MMKKAEGNDRNQKTGIGYEHIMILYHIYNFDFLHLNFEPSPKFSFYIDKKVLSLHLLDPTP